MNAHDAMLFVYNLSLVPVVFFSVLYLTLAFFNFFKTNKKIIRKKIRDFPFITVQIPTYNDPVAERCIRHCIGLDYPKNKYEIIIADDSTNVKTQDLLSNIADKYPGFIKYVHRDNRKGFKAGALKEVMKYSRGEFIVIFDSDWMPAKNFLNKIIEPFSDQDVSIVQARQGIYNRKSNLITRFAAYLLMVYHTMILPINNRINCVFFCGTAGAIRRKHFEEVDGWNANSLTEDSDLSVRLLKKGYKSVYLESEVMSEVPMTFESFLKQQMRWCYGNTRVFLDNAHSIILGKGFSLKQRIMITFVTLGNVIAPFVFLMSFAGLSGWFLGDPELLTIKDMIDVFLRVSITAGFIAIGGITLYKRKLFREFPYLLLSAFTLGLVLAVANSIAFTKAVFNMKLSWFCTVKEANAKFV
jgi:cellulose synthase/poly-beta-1,6-N-acetylglucosamine synthase-like glycosyltransferase